MVLVLATRTIDSPSLPSLCVVFTQPVPDSDAIKENEVSPWKAYRLVAPDILMYPPTSEAANCAPDGNVRFSADNSGQYAFLCKPIFQGGVCGAGGDGRYRFCGRWQCEREPVIVGVCRGCRASMVLV